MTSPNEATPATTQDSPAYLMNWGSMPAIVYYLYLGGLLTGVTTLVGIIMAYVMAGEFQGPLLEGHRRYLIRTFWFTLLWSVIGVVTVFLVVGYFILIAASIWFLYRSIKGLYLLSKGQSPY